jgi:hypothetical protein
MSSAQKPQTLEFASSSSRFLDVLWEGLVPFIRLLAVLGSLLQLGAALCAPRAIISSKLQLLVFLLRFF